MSLDRQEAPKTVPRNRELAFGDFAKLRDDVVNYFNTLKIGQIYEDHVDTIGGEKIVDVEFDDKNQELTFIIHERTDHTNRMYVRMYNISFSKNNADVRVYCYKDFVDIKPDERAAINSPDHDPESQLYFKYLERAIGQLLGKDERLRKESKLPDPPKKLQGESDADHASRYLASVRGCLEKTSELAWMSKISPTEYDELTGIFEIMKTKEEDENHD